VSTSDRDIEWIGQSLDRIREMLYTGIESRVTVETVASLCAASLASYNANNPADVASRAWDIAEAWEAERQRRRL
jgi:hypothetical protein